MSRNTEREMNRLIGEARKHLVPPTHGVDHDWSETDRQLFERIGQKSHNVVSLAPRPAFVQRRSVHRATIATGLALAVAAAATLVFRPTPPARQPTPELAASLEGASGVRIVGADGRVRAGSKMLLVGDRIETGADAAGFVSRNESGSRAVAWRLENASQLVVTKARAPLALALDSGAVEADVTRVPQGEAFVVDVGGMRVAVKGTHLRVARAGNRATIDLTEGTIAIDKIPQNGLTEGLRVTAPAHVELDLDHPENIRVDRSASAVRARAFDDDVLRPAVVDALRAAPTAEAPPKVVPRPTNAASAAKPTHAETRAPSEVVGDAVRACIVKHVPSGQVRVTIESTLVLDVESNGSVKLARFDPPLSPEVQTCAAEAIYKTRFKGTNLEQIKITAER